MTTQEQKDKKIATAEAQHNDTVAKLTKAKERLAGLEKEFAETKEKLAAKIATLEPEVKVTADHLEWVRSMPVSGRASGEVGAVETPAADAE